MDVKIASMYAKHKRSYLGQYGGDVLKTAAPVVAFIALMIFTSYDAVLKQAKANWSANQCNPIYMPFAGTIMPQVGQSNSETTRQNFSYCIHKDISAAISIILMPLEFVNFLILATLDGIIQGMIATMKFYNSFSKIVAKSSEETTNKFGEFLIPLTIMLTKIRDAIARASSIMLTGAYSVFSMYNIVVSGMLNAMNVVLDILIIMFALITLLIATGTALTATIVGAPAGAAMIAAGTALLLGIFTPILVIYIILAMFLSDVFGAKAKPSPFGL